MPPSASACADALAADDRYDPTMSRSPSIPLDTAPEVVDLQVQCWRAMSIDERWALLDSLCADVDRLAIAGIRADHPGIDDADLPRELARRRYGDALADAAYGPAGA